jgi:hypothetical protein
MTIVFAAVVATAHPILLLILYASVLYGSEYIYVVLAYEPSLLLIILGFIQVFYMKTKSAKLSVNSTSSTPTQFNTNQK